MSKYLLIPLDKIEQRYNELNSNRETLSQYWLGELHGLEMYLEHGRQISLDEKDIEEKALDYINSEIIKAHENVYGQLEAYKQALKDFL